MGLGNFLKDLFHIHGRFYEKKDKWYCGHCHKEIDPELYDPWVG